MLVAVWLAPLAAVAAEPASQPPPSTPAPTDVGVAETRAPVASAPTFAATSAGHASDYRISGYVQGQYESHQDSQNQLRQDGQLLNQNRFLVRRARLRVERENDYAGFRIELDGNTTNGPGFGLRSAYGSLFYRGSDDPTKVPWIQASIGLFDTPFGFELVESPRTRHFMERSIGSRAFFPGEPDVGVRLSGGFAFLRYAFAVLNGQPLDEKGGYPGRDPNSQKDLVLRLGFEERASSALRVAGGVSVLRGKGFHAGTPATKNTLAWKDLNEDGQVQPSEITAVPGSAATPSQNFDRWAVGADLQLRVTTPIGETQLFAELVVAQNLDRGLYVADPIATSIDVRHRSYYVGITQEVTPYGLIGFRTEFYDPNADAQDKQLGKLSPFTQRIRVYSPLVGLVLPHRAKLLFQADFISDFFAKDALGVPTDLHNDQATVRLQVEL